MQIAPETGKRTLVLKGIYNNKPREFFFSELHDMVMTGFFTNPLYGNNIGMMG